MAKTVFNTTKVDWMKQPMFFGEDMAIQRYDDIKYPQFDKLNQTMLGYFWRAEEVSAEGQSRLHELQTRTETHIHK